MVQDLGGTILRIDDALRQMIPALDVGGNGFDGVPIEYAEDGAQMMVQNFGQAVRVRFPMRDATGVTAWFSFECNWPTGLVVAALWPEPDPERHRLHTEPLDIEPAV